MNEQEVLKKIKGKPFDLNTIQKEIPFIARVKKNDPMDEHVGMPMENRWLEGDTIRVVKIEMTQLGTFLHNIEGQNLDIRRAELVMIDWDDFTDEQKQQHTDIMNWIGEHYPNCKDLPFAEQDKIREEAMRNVLGHE